MRISWRTPEEDLRKVPGEIRSSKCFNQNSENLIDKLINFEGNGGENSKEVYEKEYLIKIFLEQSLVEF